MTPNAEVKMAVQQAFQPVLKQKRKIQKKVEISDFKDKTFPEVIKLFKGGQKQVLPVIRENVRES